MKQLADALETDLVWLVEQHQIDDFNHTIVPRAESEVETDIVKCVNHDFSLTNNAKDLQKKIQALMAVISAQKARLSDLEEGSVHWSMEIDRDASAKLRQLFPQNEEGEFIINDKTIDDAAQELDVLAQTVASEGEGKTPSVAEIFPKKAKVASSISPVGGFATMPIAAKPIGAAVGAATTSGIQSVMESRQQTQFKDELWDSPLTLEEVLRRSDFETILRKCRIQLSIYARKFGFEQDEDDVFQETLLKLMKMNLAEFESIDNFVSYFCKIGYCVYIQLRRKASTKKRFEDKWGPATTQGGADTTAMSHEIQVELYQLLAAIQAELKPSEAAVLLTRAYSHLDKNHPAMADWMSQSSTNPNIRRSDLRRGKQTVYRWLDSGRFSSELKQVLRQLFKVSSR